MSPALVFREFLVAKRRGESTHYRKWNHGVIFALRTEKKNEVHKNDLYICIKAVNIYIFFVFIFFIFIFCSFILIYFSFFFFLFLFFFFKNTTFYKSHVLHRSSWYRELKKKEINSLPTLPII